MNLGEKRWEQKPGAGKEFKGKRREQKQSARSKERIQGKEEGNRSEVPGARKEFKGKEKGTEAKCARSTERI
jgi:hypothetical protein